MYIQVIQSKLTAWGAYPFDEYTDEVKEVEYEDYQANPNKYMLAVESEEEIEVIDYKTIVVEEQIPIYDENGEITGYETVEVEKQVEDGSHTEIKIHYTLVLNPDFEKEQEQKEKERIGKLTCTKRVFALMLQELGITYTQLKTLIASNEQAELEWDLCVELERKNPLLDIMAGTLGITPAQLDGLFRYANGEITIEEFRGLVNHDPSTENGNTDVEGVKGDDVTHNDPCVTQGEEITDETDVNNPEATPEETPVTDEVLNGEDVNNLEG